MMNYAQRSKIKIGAIIWFLSFLLSFYIFAAGNWPVIPSRMVILTHFAALAYLGWTLPKYFKFMTGNGQAALSTIVVVSSLYLGTLLSSAYENMPNLENLELVFIRDLEPDPLYGDEY